MASLKFMEPGTVIQDARVSASPQLWVTFFNHATTVRIVFPDGKVQFVQAEFERKFLWPGAALKWRRGCTSRPTMRGALNAVMRQYGYRETVFLGYL